MKKHRDFTPHPDSDAQRNAHSPGERHEGQAHPQIRRVDSSSRRPDGPPGEPRNRSDFPPSGRQPGRPGPPPRNPRGPQPRQPGNPPRYGSAPPPPGYPAGPAPGARGRGSYERGPRAMDPRDRRAYPGPGGPGPRAARPVRPGSPPQPQRPGAPYGAPHDPRRPMPYPDQGHYGEWPNGEASRRRKPKKKASPVMILLDVLIVCLVLGGLYFLIRPKYDHYMQDKKTRELDQLMAEDKVDDQTGQIGLWIDPYANPVNSGGIDLPPGVKEEDIQDYLPKPGEKVFVQSIARMVIRKIDLNMPIVWGASDAPLQVGLGWYTNSVPIEDDGNSVILGHRMWDYGRHFNRLDEVSVGDPIDVYMNGKRYTYRMTDSVVCTPQEMFSYFDAGDKNMLTLVTCTPKRSFEDRLLVFADLESVEDDDTMGLPPDMRDKD